MAGIGSSGVGGVVLTLSTAAVSRVAQFQPFTGDEVGRMAVAAAVLVAYYVVARRVTTAALGGPRAGPAQLERARSWLLTAAVAGVMSVGGVAPAVAVIHDCLWEGRYSAVVWTELDDSDPRVGAARTLAHLFFTFCAMDLAVGSVDYPNQLAPTTGWAHHIVYMAFIVWMSAARTCSALTVFGICEVPTLVLAAGNICKRARADWTFGALFFLTRIAYFSALWYPILLHSTWPRVGMATFLLSLHCLWFTQWVLGMVRRANAAAAAASAGGSGAGTGSGGSVSGSGGGSGGGGRGGRYHRVSTQLPSSSAASPRDGAAYSDGGSD